MVAIFGSTLKFAGSADRDVEKIANAESNRADMGLVAIAEKRVLVRRILKLE
jgi:hypothetical protein